MQKGKKRNIFTAVILAASLAIAIPVNAGTTQEQIEEVTEQREETQSNLISAEERIAALEAQKGNSEGYLAELNHQLAELSEGMAVLQQQAEDTKTARAQAEAELAEARELEASQYNDMKLRIQYIYEESTSAGLLESLFSAESFSDFLNRADEMDQINQFDREMLESYSNTVRGIEEKEQRLLEDEQRIAQLQAAQQEQQAQIEAVYENAYREFEEIVQNLENSENEQAALIAQIQAQEDALNQLLAQKYAEEAAAAEAQRAAEAAAAAQAQAAAEAAAAAQAQAAAQMQSAGYSEPEAVYVPQETAVYTEEPAASAPVEAPAPVVEETPAADGMTYLGHFTLTAYCNCSKCCGKWAAYAGLTASGAQIQEGVTVAMGGVPFGTKLLINGHVYTVQDRGTPYGHVDIFFSTHAAACAFGMQYADVYQVN